MSMKSEELIRFVSSTVSNHEVEKVSQRRRLLLHIIRHKNNKLYQENKEGIQDFINTMIDKLQKKVVAAKEHQQESLAYWQEVQAKLIEITKEALPEL